MISVPLVKIDLFFFVAQSHAQVSHAQVSHAQVCHAHVSHAQVSHTPVCSDPVCSDPVCHAPPVSRPPLCPPPLCCMRLTGRAGWVGRPAVVGNNEAEAERVTQRVCRLQACAADWTPRLIGVEKLERKGPGRHIGEGRAQARKSPPPRTQMLGTHFSNL